MNVFVLNTGRCGSTTLVEACSHITNFSAAHESRAACLGIERFAFPLNHIEADNRLSWVLGRLDQAFGDSARYVHLIRDREATAASFARRYDGGIMRAYRKGILFEHAAGKEAIDVCRDYCDTVNSNIAHFLKDKSYTMEFHLENAKEDFRRFWDWMGAEGDLESALAEWDLKHNASTGKIRKMVGKIIKSRSQ